MEEETSHHPAMSAPPSRRRPALPAIASLALAALAATAASATIADAAFASLAASPALAHGATRASGEGSAGCRFGCADTLVVSPGNPPSDFVAELAGGGAPAIPGVYYSLRIRVDRAGRGTFRYHHSDEGSPVVEGTFNIADSAVRQLHAASARLWTPRAMRPAPNPGSAAPPTLRLTGYGRTVTLDRPLHPPFDADAAALVRALRAAVPDSLWARAGAPSR